MDQTSDTADLTECEKYLNYVEESESDSECEEEVAQDALLGGIRSGLSTITRTTRKALSTCKNKIELDDATSKIQESTLKLLKLEKSFLKTASIVSDVINDLVDNDEEDTDIKPHFYLEEIIKDLNDNSDLTETVSNASDDADGASGDPCSGITRLKRCDVVTRSNMSSIGKFKDKMSKEFHKRLGDYEQSLTDSNMKGDKKFVALLDQIKLGRNDAKLSMKKFNESSEESEVDNASKLQVEKSFSSKMSENSMFLSSIPYTSKELLDYAYKSYNEDDDMDHSVLPAVDPISKDLISFPVKNRYCNHVFDKNSVASFITSNPTATCPVHMCKNKRPLEMSHFVFDSVLTTHVRRKNNFC